MKTLSSFCLIIMSLLFLSCNTVDPPENKSVLNISVEDVSCTEAWIKLTTSNLNLPAEINLITTDADGTSSSQISILNTQDSLLYIDSLLPNKTYSFQAVYNIAASEEVTAATMDTTSHNFTWQTFEFGDPLTGNSSVLYDVSIINENSIWAVGEIYVKDSLGQTDHNAYNAAHWNGNEWELKRIMFYTFCGMQDQNSYPARAVFAIDNETIVIASNSQIAYLKNGSQIRVDCIPASVNKIWGTSSNDFYVVGNNGNIAHYQKGEWIKIESATDLPLTDIYGKQEGDIFISGAYTLDRKGILLRGNEEQFSVMINSETINESELFRKLYGELSTVWIDELGTIYTGGNLLFRYKNNEWNYETSLPENYIGGNRGTFYRGYIYSIRGNASNDFIIAGDRNTLKHFNGYTWQQIGLPYSEASQIVWRSISMKNTMTAAVGYKSNKASVILLKR